MTRWKLLRLERGWSKNHAVRQMMAASEVSLPGRESLLKNLSRWENGECAVSAFYLALLARVYDVPLADVHDGTPTVVRTDPRRANAAIYSRVFMARAA